MSTPKPDDIEESLEPAAMPEPERPPAWMMEQATPRSASVVVDESPFSLAKKAARLFYESTANVGMARCVDAATYSRFLDDLEVNTRNLYHQKCWSDEWEGIFPEVEIESGECRYTAGEQEWLDQRDQFYKRLGELNSRFPSTKELWLRKFAALKPSQDEPISRPYDNDRQPAPEIPTEAQEQEPHTASQMPVKAKRAVPKKRGRPPGSERGDAIRAAAAPYAEQWRLYLPRIFESLLKADVDLGSFYKLRLDLGDGHSALVENWEDLGLAKDAQHKKIVDVLRKTLERVSPSRPSGQ